MVEKVARAIGEQQSARMAARYPARFCYSGATWEQLSDGSKEDARLTARAAIEAMREPTEAMIYAGLHERAEIIRHADTPWDFRIANSDAHVWRAMLTAALE